MRRSTTLPSSSSVQRGSAAGEVKQSAELVPGQLTDLPAAESAEPHRPDPGPGQPPDRMADRFHGTAHDVVPALVQGDLDQRAVAAGRDDLHGDGADRPVVERNSLP